MQKGALGLKVTVKLSAKFEQASNIVIFLDTEQLQPPARCGDAKRGPTS